MKFTKFIPVALIGLFLSCGSSERVIMDDGTVYNIKKNDYFQNGEEVTDQLSLDEKKDIQNALNKRLDAERLAEEKKEQFEEEQDKAKEALEKAEEKQEKLEEKQEKLEDALEEKEDARKDFLKAKDKLQDKKEKFAKLKEKGKLSPNDIEKWESKILGWEQDLKKASDVYNRLK